MQDFMCKAQDKFDLCVASLCLHYLIPCRVDDFLADVSKKCSSLAAVINLGNDIIENMVDIDINKTDSLNMVHDAFIAIDTYGIITEWNQQAEHTFGWSCEEILGQKLVDTIIPVQFREAQIRAMKNLRETKVKPQNQQIELTALHRNGHEFPIALELVDAEIHAEQKKSIGAAFVRDLTERKIDNENAPPANLQRANMNSTEWLRKIGEHFSNIQHKVAGQELYIYATK